MERTLRRIQSHPQVLKRHGLSSHLLDLLAKLERLTGVLGYDDMAIRDV